MVANTSKFQVILVGIIENTQLGLHIDKKIINASNNVKPLGVTIDKI